MSEHEGRMVQLPTSPVESFLASSFCPDDAIRGQPQTGTAWCTLKNDGPDLYYVSHWNGEVAEAVRSWGSASCRADAHFLRRCVEWFQSMTQARQSHDDRP